MRKRTQITLVAVAKARISLVHCTLLTHRLVVFRVYGFIDWSVSISRKFDVGNSRLIFEHFFDCWHLSKNRLWNGSKKEKNWLYAVQTCLICCSKALNLIWYLAKSVWLSRDSDRQRTRERERKKKLYERKYSCQQFQCVDANWRRCICMFFKQTHTIFPPSIQSAHKIHITRIVRWCRLNGKRIGFSARIRTTTESMFDLCILVRRRRHESQTS